MPAPTSSGIKIERLPLAGETTLRANAFNTQDQFYLNGYFEKVDVAKNQSEYFFTKRPGLDLIKSPGGTFGSGIGKGCYFWRGSSKVYTVVDSTLKSTDIVSPFTTSSALYSSLFQDNTVNPVALSALVKGSFAETRPGATNQYVGFNDGLQLILVGPTNTVLVMNNVAIQTSSVANPTVLSTGTKPHRLQTGNQVIIRNHIGSTPSINDTIFTVTAIDSTHFSIPVNVTVGGTGGTIGVFPTNVGNMTYLDGYWFVVDFKGNVWNCKVDDPTTWAVTDFITALMQPSEARSLAVQNNMLLIFGTKNIQMFFDAANPVGSPLQNSEQNMLKIGTIHYQSVAQKENKIFFVGSHTDGEFQVWRIDGTTQLSSISSPAINRLIKEDVFLTPGSSSDTAIANLIRTAGHLFYVLHLENLGITLVYDVELNTWFEWTVPVLSDITQTDFNVSLTQSKHWLWVQRQSDGSLNNFDPSTTQDNGVSFEVRAQTVPITFGSMKRNYYNRVELIGDKQAATTPVLVSYSDDDYNTFSPTRTFDMQNTRTFSRAWGQSRRRSWRISYTGDQPLRLWGLEFEYQDEGIS